MGADKDIIVALEFGTSAIRGIAGRRKADGTVQILDIEKENIANAIQRGVIYNIDKTTQAITTIVARLNERLNIRVVRAYVGIGGQSLHTAGNVVSRNMETKVKITPEIVDNLKDNNLTTQYSKSRILEVVPQEYIVGNRTVTDPVGIQSEQIEARFMNVVAKNTLIENIQKCMRMAKIEIVDMLISPLALADALLTDSEKRSGCAMVDFGAGTTTVAIYNGNLLRHLTVIPLGGNNITDDIATGHQMASDEAETLKRKRGIAYVAAESDNPQMLPISNDRTISENDLLYIIGARQEEIIANVWSHIEPVSDKLLSGIVITGGAAQLKDTPAAIKHFTQ
ncbi:MAG: cell division protein FtsA, partial [Bacteroidaceae bacterium]|nr:cell division protein FtsA [Bacteroidaceae bacterium]